MKTYLIIIQQKIMSSLIIISLLLSLAATSQSQVPENATFSYENSGEFGPYVNEYDGDYRAISIFAAPFQVAFYNTTPNAYTLAIRIGLQRQEPLYRWVWEANRGNPVGEDATFSLRRDGNLVLAERDGRVKWQTNTAGKGVVGFDLLPNGNMVLLDKSGRFVWQSFDHATDTLLVGQWLRIGGVSQLVSRLSKAENKNGPYRLALEPRGLSLYYKNMLYFRNYDVPGGLTLTNVTFQTEPENDEGFAWDMSLKGSVPGGLGLGRPKYNTTLSYLRLGSDGNVKVYTYNDKVDWGPTEVVFKLFDRDQFIYESDCQLPERCGALGVCEDNQCVACPTEKGLLGWSKSCGVKKVSCDPSKFRYYKVVGVDHFLSKYNRGSSVTESDCGKKCTSDCKCLGYFYNRDTSRCLVASELKTLTKVPNSTHVGFIKTPI